MQCHYCGTTDAPNWVTHKTSTIIDTKTGTLHTVKHETHTIIFCPQCYEEEAINAI